MGLIDVHAPALFINGDIHWQMAAGHDAVDVRITGSALHALAEGPLPSYREIFERNREKLCALAVLKYAARGKCVENVVIERDDLA